MSDAPVPRPGILDIAPYKPGAASGATMRERYKLSANESALGASPEAARAYQDAAGALAIYPDGGANALRAAIAETHGLPAERIVCGAGSDELLQLLARAYAGPGDSIVQSAHGFLVYALAAKSCGAAIRFAPETDMRADIDALAGAVDETTKIVFIANPNNPTGAYLSAEEVRGLREALPPDVLLVVDAAYAEYMEEPDYEAGAALALETDNTVMTRTFSKIYGLASLRLGWALCPPGVADALNRIRGPFNISTPAQAAGIAALRDQAFVARNAAHNRDERAVMAQRLAGMGLTLTRSFGNFLLFRAPDGDAATLRQWLDERGVSVREMGAYQLPEWLRVSIGPAKANRRFLDLMEERLER